MVTFARVMQRVMFKQQTETTDMLITLNIHVHTQYSIFHSLFFLSLSSHTVNGIGGPGVMPPFTAIGLGAPSLGNYGGGIPSLGAFALASTAGALGNANQAALRGLSNVLLVSNLNEEVNLL